jgi:hypothetical protein
MKIYHTIDEWKKDWTPEKQKLYQDRLEEKYGKNTNPHVLIHDNELSEITGKVIITIPII